mmetsp:Transcript_23393/g.41507  ORF Transcript_23393/g.41507 Transcript_23393/m.41507 type:complete len:115 (-) Transcript_23393:1152-1496(-)
MEDQLKHLVQHLDSVMENANKVKKTLDNPSGIVASLDQYTASLDALLDFSNKLEGDFAEFELPDELLAAVSEGKRPEDFNRQTRQELEAEISERRNCAEGLHQLLGSIGQHMQQ